jgi:hypothetical protein
MAAPRPSSEDFATAAAAELVLKLKALRASPVPTDRALAEGFRKSCLTVAKTARVRDACDEGSPLRERAEALVGRAQEDFVQNFARINKRAAEQAEETPRQKERRRRFADARKHERGMSPDQRERERQGLYRRLSYSVARRHGASQVEARRFSLGLPPPRQAASGNHTRARRPSCARRRGSRRIARSSSSSGEPPGDESEPALAGPSVSPFDDLPDRGSGDASWQSMFGATDSPRGRCSRCGIEAEILAAEQLDGEVVCLRCFTRATVSGWHRFLVAIGGAR